MGLLLVLPITGVFLLIARSTIRGIRTLTGPVRMVTALFIVPAAAWVFSMGIPVCISCAWAMVRVLRKAIFLAMETVVLLLSTLPCFRQSRPI
jgi:hypothetical protein